MVLCVNTLLLTEKGKIKYLELLPNKIWKVLPLSEKDEGYKKYLKRLLDDISNINDLFDCIFTDILIKLNVIYNEELNHSEIKSRVLECTNEVERLGILAIEKLRLGF